MLREEKRRKNRGMKEVEVKKYEKNKITQTRID